MLEDERFERKMTGNLIVIYCDGDGVMESVTFATWNSPTPLAMESAISRTPVELWRDIFRQYLGPPIPDVDQAQNLQEFRDIILSSKPELLQRYRQHENLRNTLRRVCRAWKLLADQMEGSRIVVNYGDGHLWPPNSDLSKADRVHYRITNGSPYDPVFNYRKKLGIIPRHYNSIPVGVGFGIALPKTAIFESRHFIVPDGGEDTPDHIATVRAIRISYTSFRNLLHNNSLRALSHSAFRRLLAVSLDVEFPFCDSSSLFNFTLQELKCLILQLSFNVNYQFGTHDTHHNILSTWNFPKLTMLKISGSFPMGSQNDVNEFFGHHGENLEELDYSARCREVYVRHVVHDWRILRRLKAYHQYSLIPLAHNLPFLGAWTASHRQRLRIVLSIGWMGEVDDDTFPPSLDLNSHKEAISMLIFVLPHRWAYYADLLQPSNLSLRYLWSSLEKAQKLFAVVEEVGARVEDVSGECHDSESAAPFRKLLANYRWPFTALRRGAQASSNF